ncbi:MAG TPA: hypothetical protein VKT27_10585 [Candidatus Binataceae bacterium]|nr:hypothetical protein [Candidatus Binataceae bacterium]
MTIAKKLTLIGAGYALAGAGGLAAVAVNEMRIPADIQQTSGGMVAFGDMIVFVLASGFLSLLPSWFLLKLCVEKIPRILIAAELLAAALGPVSWLTVRWMAAAPPNPRIPAGALGEMLGPLIAFGALPRIAFGPVLVMIEGATFFLARERATRALLGGAMLMDLVPLGVFGLHIAAAMLR